ncbi:hypothetical protein [Thermococcus gorgonarius]|uniref:Uncharacterized protein n=1 Tax=Thermococcus gorgonarius TaxID=71997 RepID=A0A2Z2MAE2_THEGO|nr:hypothetical protein [Thermococcus gorgonarius]ASJ01512.1 hypothetical protein A3K92_08475 [Thermococcus gorgonarius]
MVRKIVALVLILTVFSAGCLVQIGSKPSASRGFSVNVTAAPFNVPVNITAVMVNVSVNFVGYRHLTVHYSYPVIFIKVGGSVYNVSTFRLSNDVYMVPSYSIPAYEHNESGVPLSLTAFLNNGSIVLVDIEVSGVPNETVDMVVNYEVEKNGTHYVVRPLGWSLEKITLWGEVFNLAMELHEPIQIANAPAVRFVNGTYIVPSVCKVKNGNTVVSYKYSIGDVYIVGPAGRGFVGKVYFPCEKMSE